MKLVNPSVLAFAEVETDPNRKRKSAAILISLLETPVVNDQVCVVTQLSPGYVRPRVSQMKSYGLIEPVVITKKALGPSLPLTCIASWSHTRRTCSRVRRTCKTDDEFLDATGDLIEECRRVYEVEQARLAAGYEAILRVA